MEKQKYMDDLKNIREIMERSSKFMSLSGLSGISAGIIALIGAYLAYRTVYIKIDNPANYYLTLNFDNILILLGIAVATLVLALSAGIIFTNRKARKDNQKIWNLQTKRLIINLSIPLITGGMVCLILLMKGFIGLTAPLTLLFYGLALVNASKYTLSEIRGLGIAELILGIIAVYFIGYGLLFWAVGFGILHIVYGIVMHIRYGS